MTPLEQADQQNVLKNHQRKRWLVNLSLLFLSLGVIYLIYWTLVGRFYETTDDAYVSGNLVQVMPQISGQVTEILADETDHVVKGQPLIYLDKADAEIALKRAEAQLATTVRQVRNYYHQVDEMQANVALQTATLEKNKADYARRQKLVVNKFISSEDLQHSKIAVDQAAAALQLAKNQLASAISSVSNTDLYHHPRILEAAVQVRNTYLNWRRTIIYAPETGYVAKRNVEVGQQVSPNTILMVIVPLNQIWVNANFKESQLKNMRIGQPVDLISDTYGSSVNFAGEIVGLSPGAGNTFDLLPPQNATGNWIKIVQRLPVRISIDKNQLDKHPLQLGLSMTVTVNTHNRHKPILAATTQQKIIYRTENYNVDTQRANQIIAEILKNNAENVSLH